MATFLDLGILSYLTPLFTFLFILVISYAVLDKFKLLGEQFAPKAIASFSIAMIFILSTRMLNIINTATPWFVLMIVIAFFIIALLMFMGLEGSAISKTMKSGSIIWPIIILTVIIFLITIIGSFQDVQDPYDDDKGKTRTTEGLRAIVHPRLLGGLFLLIISVYAVMFISQGYIKPS